MSSDNTFDEQKAANLARIRDNQRRSRARRKEYLQELEERYRVCEQLGVEASAEMQSAARRVIEENRLLRDMLKRHGYTDQAIDQAVHDGTTQMTPVAGLEILFGQRKRIPPTTSASSSASPATMSSSGGQGQFSVLPSSSAPVQRSYAESSGLSSPVTQWSTSIYPQSYSAQPAVAPMTESSGSTLSSSQRYGVPSLQSIKTEHGYDPQQEEIDSQNAAEAEYALHNNEQYDMMKRYS